MSDRKERFGSKRNRNSLFILAEVLNKIIHGIVELVFHIVSI